MNKNKENIGNSSAEMINQDSVREQMSLSTAFEFIYSASTNCTLMQVISSPCCQFRPSTFNSLRAVQENLPLATQGAPAFPRDDGDSYQPTTRRGTQRQCET